MLAQWTALITWSAAVASAGIGAKAEAVANARARAWARAEAGAGVRAEAVAGAEAGADAGTMAEPGAFATEVPTERKASLMDSRLRVLKTAAPYGA